MPKALIISYTSDSFVYALIIHLWAPNICFCKANDNARQRSLSHFWVCFYVALTNETAATAFHVRSASSRCVWCTPPRSTRHWWEPAGRLGAPSRSQRAYPHHSSPHNVNGESDSSTGPSDAYRRYMDDRDCLASDGMKDRLRVNPSECVIVNN
jgi:hypothetical protein